MLIHDPKEHPYNPSLDHPLSPRGRFGRLAYLAWYLVLSLAFMLPVMVGAIVFGLLSASPESQGNLMMVAFIIMLIAYVVFFYYIIVITIRRLHDLGQTGWLCLLMLVPLVNLFFMLYIMFAKGTPTNNEFGAPRPNKTWEDVVGKIYIALTLLGLILAIVLVASGSLDFMDQIFIDQMQKDQMQIEQIQNY